MAKVPTGTLFLIPCWLGEGDIRTMPEYIKATIHPIKQFIVEHEKTARHFLKAMAVGTPLQQIQLYPLNMHTPAEDVPGYLAPLLAGEDMGLISEAGCPAVADPGANVVEMAHRKGIKVVPLVGPSSILLALMASGFNGQNFAFVGYLPIERLQRTKRIKELEKLMYAQNQTQLFIETPYRNGQLFADIIQTCDGKTKLCVAMDITTDTEQIRTLSVSEWLKIKDFDKQLHKRPAVFAIYK